VVFIFVVEELELWISNFFYTYLPSTLLPPLGGCSQSLPFPKREPAGQIRVCKTPGWLAGWLADGSCKQLKELGFGSHTIAWFSINLQRTVQKP
jgi:hypothetical protein